MMGRVRQTLQREVPLRWIFEAPTPRGLGSRVEPLLREGVVAPPLVAGARPARVPLSFAQQRLWFVTQLEPESAVYNSARALRGAVETVVARHEVLRTRFVAMDGEPWQVIDAAGPVAVPVDSQPGADAAAVAAWVQAEAARPFDLAVAAPWRARLLAIGPAEHVLLLVLHHSATAAWSIGVLLRELATAYAAARAGTAVPLAVQYAYYALWQRAWLQGEMLATQLAYWRGQLAGVIKGGAKIDHEAPFSRLFSQLMQASGRSSMGTSNSQPKPKKHIALLQGVYCRARSSPQNLHTAL